MGLTSGWTGSQNDFTLLAMKNPVIVTTDKRGEYAEKQICARLSLS